MLIYPVVGILVIGLGMNYVIEPVMGAINTGLNSFLVGMGSSSRIILGFVLAAMMAIDMGGPFNKAAYVFGTASIAYGNYDIMAAVMIGGMVPPCAIALATRLFKRIRPDKLYHGSGLYYRRCHSICGGRSASRYTSMPYWFWNSRSNKYVI